MRSSNNKTYTRFAKVFEASDNHEEALRIAITEITLKNEMDVDHPMCEKLALYTQAHRNYLASLTQSHLRESKVNWGLRQIKSLSEGTHTEEPPTDDNVPSDTK